MKCPQCGKEKMAKDGFHRFWKNSPDGSPEERVLVEKQRWICKSCGLRTIRVNDAASVTKFKCLRCGHEWFSKGGKPPRRCAKCKTPYWDKPRKEKVA